MSIVAKLGVYKGKGGDIYGVYPYGSFFALRTAGYGAELRKYIDAIIYFKKNRRNLYFFKFVIDSVKSDLQCDEVAAVPSSTAGKLSVLQELYGEKLRRTKDSPQRKYNHKAELDEKGKIKIEMDCRGKRVLLVDDIATTGKTLYYFKRMLEQKGAKVELLALGLNYNLVPPDADRLKALEEEVADMERQGNDTGRIVGTNELADWLCVMPSYITVLKRYECVVEDRGGFNLKESVRAYIAYIKERRKEKGANNLDDTLKFWKIERAKQAVRSWRLQRDREVALVILQRLASKVADLRSAIEGGEDVRSAIDALLDGIADEPAEDIAYTVEGDETEDEE